MLEEPSMDREVKNLFIDSNLLGRDNTTQTQKWASRSGNGRSRGGLTRKIHASGRCWSSGCFLSAGQANDMMPASWLVEGQRFERIVVDKAYDFEAFIAFIKAQDAEAVIPACRCSKPRDFDKQGYRNSKKNLIGRLFNKISIIEGS